MNFRLRDEVSGNSYKVKLLLKLLNIKYQVKSILARGKAGSFDIEQ